MSRVIRELTKVGLIEMGRQQIQIVDQAGLAEQGTLWGD
ncbi:MAG TPA: hypothetical protein PKE23_10425 [Anaerolineales bacterium]|nr:hypothetical protein [Anaerolineales bacterium]HNK63568.1 hypothetical protein [Anaerolineales bacterium]HNO30612.1 hypothetical protein [Anaerolineales bacterium]